MRNLILLMLLPLGVILFIYALPILALACLFSVCGGIGPAKSLNVRAAKW
jgi:hypothetical protein